MGRRAPGQAKFAIVCPDYRLGGFRTREQAEAFIPTIVHCTNDHHVEEEAPK